MHFFITEKLSEAHNRLETFGIVAQDVSGSKVQENNCVIRTSSPIKRKNTNIKQIKMAVCELYLSLAFLQKYQVVLHTHTHTHFGVSKIFLNDFGRDSCSGRLHLFAVL